MNVLREPSTALGLVRDVSEPRECASTVPGGRARITEADLLRTIGRPLRVLDCACGGSLAAIEGHWDDITEAIRVHNDSEKHAAWRMWRETD